MIDFSLVPFRDNGFITEFDGSVLHSQTQLQLTYKLTGNLEKLHWPEANTEQVRELNLWEDTCFELFLSIPDKKHYYEFNFSPSGNWHSFSFSDYRKDRRASREIQLVSSNVIKDAKTASVTVCVEHLFPDRVRYLELGVCAILHRHPSEHHYYALGHGKEKPDFHLRDHHTIDMTLEEIEDNHDL